MTERNRLPNRRAHEVIEFTHGSFRYVAGIGRFGNGDLAEVFLSSPKTGTAIESQARDLGIVASVAFQHGTKPETIVQALSRDDTDAPASPLCALLDLLASEAAS